MQRVLVFPSCTEPGLEVIHALAKSNKVELIGGSSIDTAFDPSRLLLRHHVRCPYFGKEGFSDEFKRILGEHKIDVVFPTVDILVAEFAGWRTEGVTFVTPRAGIARLLLSKAKTFERLRDVVPVPRVEGCGRSGFPLFAKPDQGSGARGTMLITGEDELALARSRELLVTEYLPGDEYTVDCIGDLEGRLLACQVRIRAKIGRNIALGTRGADEEEIEGHVRRIAETLRIEGPWFAQFKKDEANKPRLTEINARVGGSMTYTRLCGVNIPLMAYFLFTGTPVEAPPRKSGVLLNRALANLVECESFECVIWDLDDTILRKDGKPDPEMVSALYDCHNRGIRQLLLSKNPDVERLLDAWYLPRFFIGVHFTEDKAGELARLFREYKIKPTECVMVNDSFTEAQAVRRQFPGLRIVTPDAIELLGREPIR